MRKLTISSLILLIFVATINCVVGVAFASFTPTNFELVFPTENYFQIEPHSIVGANSELFAIFNPSTKQITVFDETSFVIHCESATSLVLFSDFIFAKNETGYMQFSISEKNCLDQLTLHDAPDNFTLYANGNTLFAVGEFGTVCAYDFELNLIATTSNMVLINSTKSSNYEKIYTLDYTHAINKFVVSSIDTSNSCIVEKVLERDDNYTHFAVGEYIYIAYSRDNKTTLSVYSLSGTFLNNQIFDYEFKTLLARGNKIYALNKNSTALFCYKSKLVGQNLALELEKTIAKQYGDNSHLVSPSDILQSNDTTYIADTGNNRLLSLKKTGTTTVTTTTTMQAPTSIAQGSNGVYVASKNKVLFVKDGAIENEFTVPTQENILSIATTDKLYALTQNSVYVYTNNEFKIFKTVSVGKKLATSASGNILYVLSASSLKAFNEAGIDISTPFEFVENSIVDIDIDYVGNLYAITASGEIWQNIRELASFETPTKIQLRNGTVGLGVVSALSIGSDGKLYFASRESFVATTSVFTPALKDSFTPTQTPQINAYTQSYTAKTNKSTYFLIDPKNFEHIEEVAIDTPVFCFSEVSENSSFVYAIFGTKFGYINVADLSETAQGLPQTTNVKTLHPICKVYLYPIARESTPSTNLDKNTKLKIIGDVSGFQNPSKWFKVQYNQNQIGYIVATDVTVNNDTELIQGDAIYGKAKASRIGEHVSIYELPDSLSSVLETVTDGTELQVLDDTTYDGFVKVKCGSVVGFVLSSEIKMGGLTPAQIVAIVISCITIVVAVAIFFITNKLKKHAEL